MKSKYNELKQVLQEKGFHIIDLEGEPLDGFLAEGIADVQEKQGMSKKSVKFLVTKKLGTIEYMELDGKWLKYNV